jgi:hypothetical protein
MMIRQNTQAVEEFGTECACRDIVNIACTRSTGTIRMMNKEEMVWSFRGVSEFKCEQGGRAQEHKCMVEEGCIEVIWCRKYKMKKNRKCKERAEDTNADRAEQHTRKTIGLVSH